MKHKHQRPQKTPSKAQKNSRSSHVQMLLEKGALVPSLTGTATTTNWDNIELGNYRARHRKSTTLSNKSGFSEKLRLTITEQSKLVNPTSALAVALQRALT